MNLSVGTPMHTFIYIYEHLIHLYTSVCLMLGVYVMTPIHGSRVVAGRVNLFFDSSFAHMHARARTRTHGWMDGRQCYPDWSGKFKCELLSLKSEKRPEEENLKVSCAETRTHAPTHVRWLG